MRLDQYLVANNLVRSRGRAKELIATGAVTVDAVVQTKGSFELKENAVVKLLQEDHPYVSRAALKLKGLLETVEKDFDGKYVLDVGASTGGFTQMALEKGAKHVYAVDVGTDQLHKDLRKNPKVSNLEQTDARELRLKMFPVEPSVLICDVSFISLTKILPVVLQEVDSVFEIYCLVKPQFEVGQKLVGKGGIVTSETARLKALSDVEVCIQNQGFEVIHDMASPVPGGDGNIEYLVYAERP